MVRAGLVMGCPLVAPGGTSSLYVLLGVHGAVGSWVVRYACRMASVRREGLSKQDLKKRERGRRPRLSVRNIY